MKLFNKNKFAAISLSVLLLGSLAAPFVAEAAERAPQPRFEQREASPEKMRDFAAKLGISQTELDNCRAKGVSPRDLGHAAMLAKLSGKSLHEIMLAKNLDTSWKELAASLGISEEQLKAARLEMMAERLEQKTKLAKTTALDLLQKGYHPRDIGTANLIAAKSGKSVDEVLNQKKINNSWQDVAQSFGVNFNELRTERPDAPHGFNDNEHRAPIHF